MPRKSAASLATKPPTVRGRRRLEPSSSLDRVPAAIFRQLAAAVDVGHFAPTDIHLLEQFSESIALADEAAKRLRADGAVVGGKPSPWLAIAEKSWRASSVLASRLRLCPAARYDARAAARRADRPGPVDVRAALEDLDDE